MHDSTEASQVDCLHTARPASQTGEQHPRMIHARALVPALLVVSLDHHDDKDATGEVRAGESDSAFHVHSLSELQEIGEMLEDMYRLQSMENTLIYQPLYVKGNFFCSVVK